MRWLHDELERLRNGQDAKLPERQRVRSTDEVALRIGARAREAAAIEVVASPRALS